MDKPLLLLLACSLVIAKYTNEIKSNENVTSFEILNEFTSSNNSNSTDVTYHKHVHLEFNISAGNVNLNKKISKDLPYVSTDINESNGTSVFFSNSVEKDSNATRIVYHHHENKTSFSNENSNTSMKEHVISSPKESVSSVDSVNNSDEEKRKIPYGHPRTKGKFTEDEGNSFDKYKREDVSRDTDDDDSMNMGERKSGGDSIHKDRMYANDLDGDEEYDGDYDFDEDVEMSDGKYGIRDSLDDIIRKTVTGRDSILRRIFSRRRFFRRIIDK